MANNHDIVFNINTEGMKSAFDYIRTQVKSLQTDIAGQLSVFDKTDADKEIKAFEEKAAAIKRYEKVYKDTSKALTSESDKRLAHETKNSKAEMQALNKKASVSKKSAERTIYFANKYATQMTEIAKKQSKLDVSSGVMSSSQAAEKETATIIALEKDRQARIEVIRQKAKLKRISSNLEQMKATADKYKILAKTDLDYAKELEKIQLRIQRAETKKKVVTGKISTESKIIADNQKKLELEKKYQVTKTALEKKAEARALSATKKKEAIEAKYYSVLRFKDKNYIAWKTRQYHKEQIAQGISLAKRKEMTTKYYAELQEQGRRATDAASGGWIRIGNAVKTMIATGGVAAMIYQLRNMTIAMINLGREYEDTMAGVRAISGATEEEFKQLSDESRRLGETTRYTATEVATLEQNYARLGFSTQEIMNAASATVSLAAATGEDLANSAEIAGFTIRGFQLDASETGRVVDVMAKSFTSSALNLERFKESMKLVAPIAKTVGFSIEKTTTLLAKLADTGIYGSRAGTALRNVLSQIRNENSRLSKVLGGTASTWSEFVELLKKAKERGEEFKDKALSGLDLRIKNVVISLVDMSHTLDGFSTAMYAAGGSAKAMEDIRLNTLHGDILLAKSAFTELGLALYDKVKKPLRFITQGFTELVKHGKPLLLLAGIIGVVKTSMILLNLEMAKSIKIKIANFFLRLTAVLFGQASAVSLLTSAWAAFNAVTKVNKILIIVSALVAVGTAISYFISKTNELTVSQKKLQESIKSIEDSYADSVAKFDTLIYTYKSLIAITNRTAVEEELLAETIKTLQNAYPQHLKNLDLEKASQEELAKAINLTTAALERKMIFELRSAELESFAKQKINAIQAEKKARKELAAVEVEIKKIRDASAKRGLTTIEDGVRLSVLTDKASSLSKAVQDSTGKIENLKNKTEEARLKWEETAATLERGLTINVDTAKAMSDIEKLDNYLKSALTALGVDTEIKILDIQDFKTIAGITFENAVEGSKAFAEIRDTLTIPFNKEDFGLSDIFSFFAIADEKSNALSEALFKKNNLDLFGVDWTKYTERFTTLSDTVVKKVAVIQNQMRAGQKISDSDKKYLDFYNKIIELQKEHHEKKAKANGEEVVFTKKYRALQRATIRQNILDKYSEQVISKGLLEELIDNELKILERGNKGKKKLAEELRKALEDIAKRTAFQTDNEDEKKLNKINEYYEDRLALLNTEGVIKRKINESDVDYKERIEEAKVENEENIRYAKELLYLAKEKAAVKAKGSPLDKKEIKNLKAEITEAEAIENAKIIMLKGKSLEREKIITDGLKKANDKLISLENDLGRKTNQTEKEFLRQSYKAKIDNAIKSAKDIKAIEDANIIEIAELRKLGDLSNEQQIRLGILLSENKEILRVYKLRASVVKAIEEKLGKEVVGLDKKYKDERLAVQEEYNALVTDGYETNLHEISSWYIKERILLKEKYKEEEEELKKHIKDLDLLREKKMEVSAINILEGSISKGTLGLFGGLANIFDDISVKVKALAGLFEKNPFKAFAISANLAMQVVSEVVSGLSSIWNAYYEQRLEQIQTEKDAQLEALEATKLEAERAARFGYEQRQALNDMEFLSSETIRQGEVERVRAKHEAIIQIEDKHAQAKARIEKKALAEEKKVREQQREWAVAQAVINGAVAVTAAWSNPAAWLMIPFIIASVLAEVASIKSQKFASGGFTSAVGGRDETGERVAGTVHEKEMVFEKRITLPNLKELFILRKLLQKGYKLKDIMQGSGIKMPKLSIPTIPKMSYADGGLVKSVSVRQESAMSSKKMDELISAIRTMDSNLEENRPIINVEAKTIDPILVAEMTEQGNIDLGN